MKISQNWNTMRNVRENNEINQRHKIKLNNPKLKLKKHGENVMHEFKKIGKEED